MVILGEDWMKWNLHVSLFFTCNTLKLETVETLEQKTHACVPLITFIQIKHSKLIASQTWQTQIKPIAGAFCNTCSQLCASKKKAVPTGDLWVVKEYDRYHILQTLLLITVYFHLIDLLNLSRIQHSTGYLI